MPFGDQDGVTWPSVLSPSIFHLTQTSCLPEVADGGTIALSRKATTKQQALWPGPQPVLPPGFAGLRRAGRATACRPSKTEGCLVFWGLRLQQAQVQGESLEGNLVLTPPLVEFTRRKSGTYRINRRRKEQSVKGPLTKRIQTLILRTI